jgi:hypothetical protein
MFLNIFFLRFFIQRRGEDWFQVHRFGTTALCDRTHFWQLSAIRQEKSHAESSSINFSSLAASTYVRRRAAHRPNIAKLPGLAGKRTGRP